MPKYATDKRFQIGDYWLSQRKNGSGAWFRTWYDPQSSQTKRSSLGSTDFEECKKRLEDWYFLERQKIDQSPKEITIAELLSIYWNEHGSNLRSKDQAKAGINHWLDFYGNRTVNDLRDVNLQERFHASLFAKGMKGGTVSRVITVGRAALNRAYKRGTLESVPFIHDLPKIKRQATAPRGRPMSLIEISQLFNATPSETMRHYIVWLLATGARKEALLDLTLDRCDTENRLIELNPNGRRQTTKYRPTIRMPEVLVPIVTKLKTDYPVSTHVIGLKQTRLGSPHESWNYARNKAGLDNQVNSYSLRHTISRELSKRQVSIYEIKSHLGHKPQELDITSVYAPYNPSFLKAAAEGIDSFFDELRAVSVPIDNFLNAFEI